MNYFNSYTRKSVITVNFITGILVLCIGFYLMRPDVLQDTRVKNLETQEIRDLLKSIKENGDDSGRLVLRLAGLYLKNGMPVEYLKQIETASLHDVVNNKEVRSALSIAREELGKKPNDKELIRLHDYFRSLSKLNTEFENE